MFIKLILSAIEGVCFEPMFVEPFVVLDAMIPIKASAALSDDLGFSEITSVSLKDCF